MCSISGVLDFGGEVDISSAEKMSRVMNRRGPDSSGVYRSSEAVLCHNRLAVMDPKRGAQPMSAIVGGREYVIVYNGEVYNCAEVKEKLEAQGIKLKTKCDTEVVLYSYIVFGENCVNLLSGIFAFCILDVKGKKAFFARDPFGVKPFFYTTKGSSLLFASEVKGLLAHPDVLPKMDSEGIWQLLYMTPVTKRGSGVFKDISELEAGQCATFTKEGFKIRKYWSLSAEEHSLSREDTVEKTRELLFTSIKNQLSADVPLACFLSGGLDSSVVSAVASREIKNLTTYSFEYEGNKQNFSSSLFQPAGDDDFAVLAGKHLKTNHIVLTAPTQAVISHLFDAVRARDLPGQADIDSSLLYFCREVKRRHTVALSGECADEIFGGYPWFYRKEMLERDFFPWVHNPFVRVDLFNEDFAKKEEGFDWARQIYLDLKKECPTLPSDSPSMKQSRIASYLSQKCFMESLLERKDRMSMYSSLEVRVPFAERKLAQFVFNIPWELKFENEVEKSLLRQTAEGLLPNEILYRKKSPYPKTHNPLYEEGVKKLLFSRLARKESRLKDLLKKNALEGVEKGGTWFGQLMGTPQLLAWLIQLDIWLDQYKVEII